MKITIVAVGKLKDASLRAAIDEYWKRLTKYVQLAEIEIKDGSEEDVASRVERLWPERGTVVALEVDGKSWSSAELARFVGRVQRDATGTLMFLVGGSYGLPKRVSQRAHERLSLSAMTLPHRLARLVLVEQIYRAFTILRGEPYSH